MEVIDVAFNTYGLAAVGALMFAKAAGIPVPIPGDLILLATAARASEGKLDVWQAFAALLLAVVLGGSVQFVAARGPGRRVVYRVARLAGVAANQLDATAHRLRTRSMLSIAVALFTPGVRNVAVPACGLAGLSFGVFFPSLLLASSVDLALHFAIGAAGGNLVAGLGLNAIVIVVALLVLAIVGLVGWRLIGRGRSSFGAWQATACPACLALGAVAPRASLLPVLNEGAGVQPLI
jgi:membrane protein DedA with SNARE-associated domain